MSSDYYWFVYSNTGKMSTPLTLGISNSLNGCSIPL